MFKNSFASRNIVSMVKAVNPQEPDAQIDISTVARLTGLTAANIRMWEKRYQVVEPARTESGRRLYTERDVQRLTLLKSLSDHGHPIRTTSSLSEEQLEDHIKKEMLGREERHLEEGAAPPAGKCRLMVVGNQFVSMLRREGTNLNGTATIGEFDDLESAEAAPLTGSVDLLIVECPTFFLDTAERVQRLLDLNHALRAIVIYHYAQNKTLERMDQSISRITAIRGPITLSELRIASAADIALANRFKATPVDSAPPPRTVTEDIPKRAFSDKQIAEVSQISSAIECECPQHLASLLTSLVGFESYSRECESRNLADAKVHSYLHRTTAHARAMVEDALKVLVEFEGIRLEPKTEK
ncbi:MAG: MerR family transcriptional regulator [Verrucomicrobiota bacterium]